MGDPVLITETEHKCVVLAGLMHDLGHGIYSHLFDRQVIRSIGESRSAQEGQGSLGSSSFSLAALERDSSTA